MKEYPKWLYAAGGRTQIVQSYEQHRAAGPGWYESPAFIPAEGKGESTPQAPAAPAAPMPQPVPAAVQEMVAATEATLKKFYAAPAKFIIEQVMGLATVEEVQEVHEIETARPGGARVTVLKACEARTTQLQTPPPE